jgi:maltooligosyltrehalose trehalohydrolase
MCLQNHDQVGNRPGGERWTALMPRGARMLSAALLLLSPYTPLLFMGEEFDEQNPFLFFTNYSDPRLRKAVREGRRNEFRNFGHPIVSIPDPQDSATFERSKLNWQLAADTKDDTNKMLVWYKSLLALRKKYVVDAERICNASLKDGVLYLQVPRESPNLRISARLQGEGELAGPEPGWMRALAHTDQPNSVAIDVKCADVKSTSEGPE